MNAENLKIGTLSSSAQDWAKALSNAVDARRETTASLRRGLARACGIANGDVSAIKSEDVTEQVIANWLEEIVIGTASLVCNEAHQAAFNGAVRSAIPRILTNFGRTGSIQVAYQLPKGKPMATKFQPQFVSHCGASDDDPPWVIGLNWVEKPKIADEFGDSESFEPVEEPTHAADPAAEQAERDAQASQVGRDREAITAQARLIAAQMVESSDAFSDGQRDALLAVIAVVPEIVTANLSMVADRDLIAELKSRGFTTRRKPAAKLA